MNKNIFETTSQNIFEANSQTNTLSKEVSGNNALDIASAEDGEMLEEEIVEFETLKQRNRRRIRRQNARKLRAHLKAMSDIYGSIKAIHRGPHRYREDNPEVGYAKISSRSRNGKKSKANFSKKRDNKLARMYDVPQRGNGYKKASRTAYKDFE